MKDLIIRNKPVFIIGLATVGIFLLIILLAQNKGPEGPRLVEVEEAELIEQSTPVTGNKDAKIKIIEFSDFECPACGLYYPYIKNLLQNYGDQILLAYRHFPLPQHPNALNSAYASVAAQKQNKFWEYSDKLFTNQNKLAESDLLKYAEDLGLDLDKFKSDMNSEETKSIVNKDLSLGKRIKINSTPSFVLNDKLLQIRDPKELEQKIREAINWMGGNTNNVSKTTTLTAETSPDGKGLESISGNTKSGTIPPIEQTPTPDQIADPKIPDPYDTKITYTQDGFKPKEVSVPLNAKITWKNETNSDISIQDVNNKFDEFKNPVTVKAGEEFSFTVYKDKIFTYQEATTKNMGIIFVK